MSFVQLQTISTYSLMESTMKVDEYIDTAKKLGYTTLALTDYNVLHGAIDFYEKAIENNIKPIIGLSLNVQGFILKNDTFPIILLAKNKEGYKKLMHLSTEYQLQNEDDKLSIDIVLTNDKDLITIIPGETGEVETLLRQNRLDDIDTYLSYFYKNSSDFYLGVSLQNINDKTISFYQKSTIPTVSLGNVQYLTQSDRLPSRVLQVLNSNLLKENQNVINEYLKDNTADYSLKSPDQMKKAFENAGLTNAVREAIDLSEKINIELDLGKKIMPKFFLNDTQNTDIYLQKLCETELEQLIEKIDNKEMYYTRLEKELNIISSMGFSDYFLIVWDIIKYAHQKGIYTGSGRGSSAGSLVAYLLRITNVDPIKYNLLFERFLNKHRATMPDIDLDFPDNRREEILLYIYNKYGKNRVAQIGTIGTYGAKSAIRDVARVAGQSQEEINQWSKILPSGPNVSLKDAFKNLDVKNYVNKNKQNKYIYTIAEKIEGCNRHTSTHAAGIVIANDSLTKLTPLQKGNSKLYLTQYTMDDVEKSGMLKLDILGLRNLTTLSNCVQFVRYETNSNKFNIDKIPFDDKNTLNLFQRGETEGVFQFESSGIKRVLKKLKPTSFEDIVAVNALYRPGPMKQIDTFIKRKNGQEMIIYPHDELKNILEFTYGIMVYQEQVMQVASKVAGFTLNEADILRRAISQKDYQLIKANRENFLEGALKNNYDKKTATEIYAHIEKFADYGFNRSHAVAYSKIAYQLAYIKANYPASFFAGIMNGANRSKIQKFVKEAKYAQVNFLPPDINKSYHAFTIEKKGIRFGLNIIYGIPRDFINEIVQERKNNGQFENILDFLNRIDIRWVNKNQILPLIYSGAFDSLSETRHSLECSLDTIIDSIQMSHGNLELLDLFSPTIVKKDEFSDDEKMKQEYEATNFYFTKEPGEKYNDLRLKMNIVDLQDLKYENDYVKILVTIESIKKIITRNGKPMSFLDVIDRSGKGNLTLFPEEHIKYIKQINENDTVVVEGNVDSISNPAKLIVRKISNANELLKEIKKPIAQRVLYLRFRSLKKEAKKFKVLNNILKEHKGSDPVVIYDEETNSKHVFKKDYYVNINDYLLDKIRELLSEEDIAIKDNIK